MQKNFKLETILTIITGINLTDDFNDVYQLAYFIFQDKLINATGLNALKDAMKEHLLNIHPELKTVSWVPQTKICINLWINQQKNIYGEYLPISLYGKKLKKEKINKKVL